MQKEVIQNFKIYVPTFRHSSKACLNFFRILRDLSIHLKLPVFFPGKISCYFIIISLKMMATIKSQLLNCKLERHQRVKPEYLFFFFFT